MLQDCGLRAIFTFSQIAAFSRASWNPIAVRGGIVVVVLCPPILCGRAELHHDKTSCPAD